MSELANFFLIQNERRKGEREEGNKRKKEKEGNIGRRERRMDRRKEGGKERKKKRKKEGIKLTHSTELKENIKNHLQYLLHSRNSINKYHCCYSYKCIGKSV